MPDRMLSCAVHVWLCDHTAGFCRVHAMEAKDGLGL